MGNGMDDRRKHIIERWISECDDRILDAVESDDYSTAATQQSYHNGMEQVLIFIELGEKEEK